MLKQTVRTSELRTQLQSGLDLTCKNKPVETTCLLVQGVVVGGEVSGGLSCTLTHPAVIFQCRQSFRQELKMKELCLETHFTKSGYMSTFSLNRSYFKQL